VYRRLVGVLATAMVVGGCGARPPGREATTSPPPLPPGDAGSVATMALPDADTPAAALPGLGQDAGPPAGLETSDGATPETAAASADAPITATIDTSPQPADLVTVLVGHESIPTESPRCASDIRTLVTAPPPGTILTGLVVGDSKLFYGGGAPGSPYPDNGDTGFVRVLDVGTPQPLSAELWRGDGVVRDLAFVPGRLFFLTYGYQHHREAALRDIDLTSGTIFLDGSYEDPAPQLSMTAGETEIYWSPGPDGTINVSAGSGTTSRLVFWVAVPGPLVALLPDLYWIGNDNNVLRFRRRQNVSQVWSLPLSRGSELKQLVSDSASRLFIATAWGDVFVYSATSGTVAPNPFFTIGTIAADPIYLYVIDMGGSITKIDVASGARICTLIGAGSPGGMIVDNGTVYWIDNDSQTIRAAAL
jgi:hypothetical protein